MDKETFRIQTNHGIFYVQGFDEKQIALRCVDYVVEWTSSGNSVGSAIYKWRKIDITTELP